MVKNVKKIKRHGNEIGEIKKYSDLRYEGTER